MPRTQTKSARKGTPLQAWTKRLRKLTNEIALWSRAEGWQIQRGTETLNEKPLGDYDVPTLHVHLPGGDLFVKPVALHLAGRGEGRVDLQAFPTLNRVKLIGHAGRWRIITDSNVALRDRWSPDTFTYLAKQLVS